MNKIKDIELSSSSFQGSTFPEINNFFSSYSQSIFSKKLAEIKKEKMPNNRVPQNNRSNDDGDYETPRSNNVLTNNFFSPRSTKMLKDYTLSEKLRIKWLRSIRDYMKLQEMQVVYNYLKTANVKVLIRELRLRKCFTLWRLKYQECKNRQMWKDFALFLVKKQRTKTLKANASKIRKTRAALVKASINAENKNGESPYGVNQKIDEFAEKTVNNIIQPILSLKPSEKQDSSNQKQDSSNQKKHHRKMQQPEEVIVPYRTRDVYISENEFGSDEQDKDIKISNLEKKNVELEKRINDFERRSNEQQQFINKLKHQFIILAIVLGIIVFIAGLIVGKSIISNNRNIDTFVKSQTAITQELTAEVADFRIALTKMSGTNKTVVPVPSNLTQNS